MEIINPISIREQIADIVRDMIVNGEFKADEKISERQISTMLNVSTTPVKEAFRTLQAEGLICTVPRKGSFVSAYSKNSIKEIIFLRSAVDGVCAYFAAKKATAEEIAQMKKALSTSYKELKKHGDREVIRENNNLFHEIIREAGHNEFLMSVTSTVKNMDAAVRRLRSKAPFEALLVDYEEHKRIMDCIKARDPEGAEQAMLVHIRNGIEAI